MYIQNKAYYTDVAYIAANVIYIGTLVALYMYAIM